MSADEAQAAGRVQVRVAQPAPHEWLLTYTMDSDWLSQAAFPVRLDPAVVTYNARCEGETGLALGAATLNHDGSGVWLGGSELALTNQWQRYTRTFTMPADLPASPTITISLCAVNGAGKLWVDGAQLEEGVTASSLNLLENADFTHGAER